LKPQVFRPPNLSASEETGRPTSSFNSWQRHPTSMPSARIPHVPFRRGGVIVFSGLTTILKNIVYAGGGFGGGIHRNITETGG
jgi:hypothetical protein